MTENRAKTQKSEMLSGLVEELTGMEIKPDLKTCVELNRVLYHLFLSPKTQEMVAVNMYLSSRKTDNDLIT